MSLTYISNDRSSFQYSYDGVKKKIEYSHDFFRIASGFSLENDASGSTTRVLIRINGNPFIMLT